MKKVIRIIRKVDFEKAYIAGLKIELDYMLATLYDAMKDENKNEKEKCIERLQEIVHELEVLNAFKPKEVTI